MTDLDELAEMAAAECAAADDRPLGAQTQQRLERERKRLALIPQGAWDAEGAEDEDEADDE